MDTYKGSGVSPGIGLGKFYVINNEIDFSIPKKLSFKESQSKLDMRYCLLYTSPSPRDW